TAANGEPVRPEHADVHQHTLLAELVHVSDRRGGADHRFHLLLHRGPVQSGRPGGQLAEVRRIHPRHSPGSPDRAVPRPRAAASDAAGFALPRSRRSAAVDLHQPLRLLAEHLARPRRHLGPDRRRRRPRHDAPDGVADDDALLRRLPAVNLLVLGPQGAGKGTQSARISAAYEIPHISTGDMFRALDASTELGRKVKAIMDAGTLVPDEVTVAMIKERLSQPDADAGFVLDGFPRNLVQAEALDEMLGDISRVLDAILLFDVPDSVGMERALKRAELEGRSDDTPEAIATRLAVYHEQTEPIVEHYRVTGKLIPLHADRSVDEVWAEIEAALEAVPAGVASTEPEISGAAGLA